MSASRAYNVKCVISNIQGMSSGVTLTKTFWTRDPTPTISSFTATQTSVGVKKATCSWRCSNLISGATYEITVNGYRKAYGTASSSGSTTISFDDFSSYDVELSVYNNDESNSKTAYVDIEDYDVIPTSLNATRIDGGFTFSWSGAPSATSHQLKLVRGYGNYTTTKTVSSKSVTVTGLEYGVRYYAYVRSTRTGYDSGWVFGYSYTTSPAQPLCDISVSNRIITVGCSLAHSSNLSVVYINLYDSSGTILQKKSINSSSGTINFNKVDAGTYYIKSSSWFNFGDYYTDQDGRVEVCCSKSNGGDYVFSESIIISNRPPTWSWTSSNGTASTVQTQNAYSAITDKGYTTSFSYLVWNDMVDKVKTILDCIDESWDATYATLANTKLTSSNKELTAKQFNSLKYNIGSRYSTGISDKKTGDLMYGTYFVTLASCINNWINTI